jgi:YesN/AraC family two-component response regulator
MMTKKRSAITELNVLIVEDNQFTALTLRKTLESLGLKHVQVASNGFEALEAESDTESSPDVMLLDLRMPNMGGLELLSRLADRRFSGSIIVTSGVDEETMNSIKNVASASNLNVLGYLSKPLTAAKLGPLLEAAVA